MTKGSVITPELARALVEMRLRQTAGLLGWMVENGQDQSVKDALDAVTAAHSLIQGTSTADAGTHWATDPSSG